ncbi:hypothetical protein DXU92_06900 [Brachybacterium saurashtrense]|uniref:Uncharacterized protein n=1 Tax=Brachybacterium saurashtrense TaxID=556288 RepID=A0A345YKM0_9MICO|nr:hypothetical protein DWV08_01770 [Brachybacterium saurashtrense]RRR23084.1 hypothetical protein DXU92_06900 [Brachybacterium saurashtrense]
MASLGGSAPLRDTIAACQRHPTTPPSPRTAPRPRTAPPPRTARPPARAMPPRWRGPGRPGSPSGRWPSCRRSWRPSALPASAPVAW